MRNNLSLLSDSQYPGWSKVFDRFFDDILTPELRSGAQELPTRSVLTENENGYVLSIDLPGVSKDNVKMEIVDGVLTLSAERKSRFEGENEKSSSFIKYERAFRLPTEVDGENIEAHLDHGVLELFLPKKGISEGRKIEISAKPEGFFKKFLGKNSEEKSE